jgi:hypothetical protein
MKGLFYTFTVFLILFASVLQAQNKAELDNNRFITVAQTITTGKTLYKLTNNNSVSMDFSLYKQMKSGGWVVVHHLDLKSGQTYEDVNAVKGYSGKYVIYSAKNADFALFPNAIEIADLQAGNENSPSAASTLTPAAPAPPPPPRMPPPPDPI